MTWGSKSQQAAFVLLPRANETSQLEKLSSEMKGSPGRLRSLHHLQGNEWTSEETREFQMPCSCLLTLLPSRFPYICEPLWEISVSFHN